MNEEEMQEKIEPTETAEGGTVDETVETSSDTPTESEPVEESKTFTQDQVNEFIRERLQRVYKGYGVENQDQLNELVEKSRGYDELQTKLDDLSKERRELVEKVAFLENDINPERYEDIRAYFKGKELEFSNANLQNELTTHNEWRNIKKVDDSPRTTIESLGASSEERPKVSEKELAEKLFGVRFKN